MALADVANAIKNAIPEAEVYLKDLTGEENHFEAFVISASFSGKSRIQQHQKVMDALKGLLVSQVHAITLKTYTPESWEQAQNQ